MQRRKSEPWLGQHCDVQVTVPELQDYSAWAVRQRCDYGFDGLDPAIVRDFTPSFGDQTEDCSVVDISGGSAVSLPSFLRLIDEMLMEIQDLWLRVQRDW